MTSVSIVFPVHNEEKNLEILLVNWSKLLKKKRIKHEFVLVEDGSTDNTKEKIKILQKRFPIINLSQKKRRYYTKAVVDGIYASRNKYVLCTDSDNQIKVHSLIKNIKNFPPRNYLLIGYRNPRNDPFIRIVMSKLFKVLHDLLFFSGLKDPSCPFVLGLRSTFKKLPKKKLLLMREGFWWGFVGNCIIKKIKFIEVPIKHFQRKNDASSYKLINIFKIIIINFIGLIKIRLNF